MISLVEMDHRVIEVGVTGEVLEVSRHNLLLAFLSYFILIMSGYQP